MVSVAPGFSSRLWRRPDTQIGLCQTGQFQRDQREKQPTRNIPMALAGDGLVVNQQCSGDVGKAVQALPVFSTELANGPLITRQRQDDEDRKAGEAEPDKWLRKTLQEAVPVAFVQGVGGKMQEPVDAGGAPDNAAMSIERVDEP